ncbi:hypothetical protein HZA43_00260 [Candidatus Peregrinibacteria bacterium]|nr:hypothetical protein [Candidatus Peregrinibacteria bacterium]
MEKNHVKAIAEFVVGIAGGVLLGTIGFLTMTTYGGTGECPEYIKTLVATRGYESCGNFGALSGVIIGSLLTILTLQKTHWTDHSYKKTMIMSAFGTFIVPLLIALVIFWPTLNNEALVVTLPVIVIFIALSVIPSFVITLLINRK